MYASIAGLIVLILMSGYFSATETAFSAANRIKLKNMAKDSNKRAQTALKLYDEYDKLLSSILVGNNIVNIMSTSIATALFVELLKNNGVAVATVVMTVVILIFGEITPKGIAKEMPEKFAIFSAPYIYAICVVLTPVTLFFVKLKSALAKLIGIKSDNLITDDELLTMVKEAQADGGIDKNEGELLTSAIEFYDLNVDDILIPRVDIIAVDHEMPVEEINKIFKETRFSRIPVYKETVDNIIGVINQKDFSYSVIEENKPIDEAIKPVVYVAGNMKISKLLTLLQKKKTHLAIVTDEYGGTEGIVTLEDVIEELVGEIWDEYDEVVIDCVRLAKGCFKISCNAAIDKISNLIGIEIESESSTVGGWVMEMLEKVPEAKDEFKYKNVTVTVTKADEKRALEVIMAVSSEESEEKE